MTPKKIWNIINSTKGGYLIRRYLSVVGHIVAMIIVLRLTWTGDMSEVYFTIYTAFIAGHASLEKYLSGRT